MLGAPEAEARDSQAGGSMRAPAFFMGRRRLSRA